MKYILEIDIALPRDRVIELFDDADNLDKWQPGLIGYKHLSGTPGEVGAKAVLLYQMGARKVRMEETITHRNLPDEFFGTYEAKGVFNEMKNFFSEIDADNTRWRAETEFRFGGFMKFIAPMMKKSFRKQSYRYMEMFKEFAEQQGSGD
ncbi:MAG: SRPBCC family protein [bacterium]